MVQILEHKAHRCLRARVDIGGFVVKHFIVSSRIMQQASVRSLNPPVMPFHMHVILRRNAAHADDSVVCGIACCFELHQILDDGPAVRAFQLSQALRVLGFQCTKNLAVIADLISTEGVHGSIPGDVRQEQGGGNGLPAGLFCWLPAPVRPEQE